ncbi:Uncharacterised protein [Mycobacteroides abscessus]|nr:Uncharacterised protein [Mycobacteroides abscessus]SLC90920.1 Uncharacterised protein [Mycobacteroides abscessus subsp. massiliense]
MGVEEIAEVATPCSDDPPPLVGGGLGEQVKTRCGDEEIRLVNSAVDGSHALGHHFVDGGGDQVAVRLVEHPREVRVEGGPIAERPEGREQRTRHFPIPHHRTQVGAVQGTTSAIEGAHQRPHDRPGRVDHEPQPGAATCQRAPFNRREQSRNTQGPLGYRRYPEIGFRDAIHRRALEHSKRLAVVRYRAT